MSVDRILSQVLGSSAATGFAGGMAGGLASGMLTSKKGRKLGKKALQVGGVAALGGLAYAAYSRYRQNQSPGTPLTGAETPALGTSTTQAAPPPSFVPPADAPEVAFAVVVEHAGGPGAARLGAAEGDDRGRASRRSARR